MTEQERDPASPVGAHDVGYDGTGVERYHLTSEELARTALSPRIFERVRDTVKAEETLLLQVELAFQEALANSFEHGNLELKSEWREEIDESGMDRFSKIKAERLGDPKYADRPLQIHLSLENGVLEIEIQDAGPGFDYESRYCSVEEGVIRCHGRGLTLMNLVMDSIAYSDGGRRIRLTKRVSAE